ncbi:hypothetical protein MKX01_040640, partial [Papaver californicum]
KKAKLSHPDSSVVGAIVGCTSNLPSNPAHPFSSQDEPTEDFSKPNSGLVPVGGSPLKPERKEKETKNNKGVVVSTSVLASNKKRFRSRDTSHLHFKDNFQINTKTNEEVQDEFWNSFSCKNTLHRG